MNTDDDFSSHPISFVNHLRDKFGSNLVLGFSCYKYLPRSRVDERKRFKISIDEVTHNWLRHQLLTLQPLQELALESQVTLHGVVRHIPMLDFRGMTKGQLSAISEALPRQYQGDIDVFFSGRSYHAYFVQLLTRSQWIKFMGSALLCNTPSDPSVVDQRWVGHRLIGGYAALRWSCNTSHYKNYPQKIDAGELDNSYLEKRRYIDRALNTIEGDLGKSKHYEAMIDWALRDTGVQYQRHSHSAIGGQMSSTDFIVELSDLSQIGIEAKYSERRYLTKEQVNKLRLNATEIGMRDNLSRLLVITNSEVHETDRRLFADSNPPIDVIEQTVSPDALISRLSQYFNFAKNR